MDKLYIGDIPEEYHFAIFNNGYIDLYNRANLNNGTFTRYRIYTNVNGFFYTIDNVNFGTINNTVARDIEVTNNFCYRHDFDKVLTITLIIAIFGIFLTNIITSLIRKGGLLGGLL